MQSLSEPYRYRPPTSGSIIGSLVASLVDKPAVLRSKQTGRYFAGDIVSPKQRLKVFDALARTLLDSPILPQSVLENSSVSLQEILASVIAWHADQWDRLRADAYANSGRVFRDEDPQMAYLRLVAVDLAVRGIALFWLADLPEPGEETPMWAKELGVAHDLRRFISEAGFTREGFAEAIDISNRSLDLWLDEGMRPSPVNIIAIAEVLGQELPGKSPDQIRQALTRNYWLSWIADHLAQVVGRDNVEMLARGINVLITRILPDLRCVKPPFYELAVKIEMDTILLGCQAPRAGPLLDLMWKLEGDKEWRTDIQSAKVNWVQRIQHQVAGFGTPDSDGPVFHESFEARLVKRAIYYTVAESFEELALGADDNDAIALRYRRHIVRILRVAIEQVPDDAWLHFQLGSVLGDLYRVDPSLVDEAVQECWLAAALKPEWELPLDEIGVIYYNAGRVEESRDHLEHIAKERQHSSWNLLMSLGLARMKCGDITGALEALKESSEMEPDHPVVLSAAAHCARLLGQKLEAARYEKRARLLGA